jgi:protein-tyrosine phosphatase
LRDCGERDQSVRRILVLCTANICRSPMAAGILRRRLGALGLSGDIEVISAGTYAEPDQPAAGRAVTVMGERGIDLSGHRSQAVGPLLLASADLVLVMEEAHRRWLFNLSPRQLGKVFLLSELVGQHGDIPDPYGSGPADFERSAKLLEQIIDRGMPKLCQLAGLPPSACPTG